MRHTPAARRRIVATITVATIGLVPIACGDADDADDGASAPAAATGSGDAAAGDAAPSFGLVTPGEAASLAVDPAVTVLDVRTPGEFAEGHLDGAVSIDFYADTFADQVAELDPNATYLVYCRSGNRSGQTTALMAELGFEQVYDLDGGVIAWSAQGGQLVR